MSDYWFAECHPCAWETKHTSQDAAIRAAEDHVIDHHRDVPSHIRGLEKIGHVQNRSENAFSTPSATSPATPQQANEVNASSLFELPAPASTGTASDAPPNPAPSGE